jgi:hypothetical protein
MVILPKPETARTTPFVVAPGVSGSMMIGLVEEPRTVRLPPPPATSIHHSNPCSLKRTGPDPYIYCMENEKVIAWLDYLVYVSIKINLNGNANVPDSMVTCFEPSFCTGEEEL